MTLSTLSPSETKIRRLFFWAFATTLSGIALSVAQGTRFSAWLSAAGLVGLVFAVHRLGRLGPDAPLRFGKRRASRATRSG